ncbi:DUF2345 domain-containing protein [Undibacterium sp. Ren11W]|uniref:DUF2345 domain-containing protein n=1 Tax=Undibacterium sp. Ren11W TaxID=3413045 RepID=UPI003BF052B2
MHWAAAYTMTAVSSNATALFSNEDGIQRYAGIGPLSLQAHTYQLEILADKEITVISVNAQIMAGLSSVTLYGSNIICTCPGNFTVKAAMHVFDAGANKVVQLGKFPDGRVSSPICTECLSMKEILFHAYYYFMALQTWTRPIK